MSAIIVAIISYAKVVDVKFNVSEAYLVLIDFWVPFCELYYSYVNALLW